LGASINSCKPNYRNLKNDSLEKAKENFYANYGSELNLNHPSTVKNQNKSGSKTQTADGKYLWEFKGFWLLAIFIEVVCISVLQTGYRSGVFYALVQKLGIFISVAILIAGIHLIYKNWSNIINWDPIEYFKKLIFSQRAYYQNEEERQLYQEAYIELTNDKKSIPDWAIAMANADGNKEKAEGLYIKYRVNSLRLESKGKE